MWVMGQEHDDYADPAPLRSRASKFLLVLLILAAVASAA
jgi:hypothetical protein